MNAAPSIADHGTITAPHPDADLLALGREFHAAWAAYRDFFRAHPDDALMTDAEYEAEDAIQERCDALITQLLAITPTTLDGLKVHAMAWGWANYLPSTGGYETAGAEYPSKRAAHSVMTFLLADAGI